MKLRKRIVGIVLAIMVMAVAMPFQAYGATGGILQDDGTFYFGNNYTVYLKVKQSVWLFEGTDSCDLNSVSSQNNYIASVRDLGEGNIEITGREGGTTKVIVQGYDNAKKEFVSSEITVNVMGVETKNWVYKNTKKVTVIAKNAMKGDVIKLKIGKKTYTKKVKKTQAVYKAKIKIKKPGFYGKKYKLTLSRGKKVIAKESDYVYIGDKVHIGDRKKKVKWLTSWNDPYKKNKSAYSEQWCYDWNGDSIPDAYLYFKNGKVVNWQTFG